MYHTAYFLVPVPPVDAHVTFAALPSVTEDDESFEVFVSAALTVTFRSFVFTVPLPSFAFTRIVYTSAYLGVIVTVFVVL